jgi:hypothetical protein
MLSCYTAVSCHSSPYTPGADRFAGLGYRFAGLGYRFAGLGYRFAGLG